MAEHEDQEDKVLVASPPLTVPSGESRIIKQGERYSTELYIDSRLGSV
jgi:hypothetical protein